VQLTAKALVGVAASDGKVLWRYDKPANGMGLNCTTPIYLDGHVFATSAYGAGGGLVKLTREGKDGVKADEVYFNRKMQNHHGGTIVVDGYLYGAHGGNEGGYLTCLEFKRAKSSGTRGRTIARLRRVAGDGGRAAVLPDRNGAYY
jgi:hypothetical protein